MYIDISDKERICLQADNTAHADKADTADKLSYKRLINGVKFDGSSDIYFYGTCSTAKGTAAKTVTLQSGSSFVLKTGVTIAVKFTNANTIANPTLNVNNTGAKPIYRYGTTAASTADTTTGWRAGSVLLLTYDGTGWIRHFWENTNTVPAGYCTTAADTAAKTATCTDYALKTNSYLHLIIKTANTSKTALTLNVNGKGAKPIYINGAASSASNYTLPAGSYITFYNGTNYYIRTDGKLPGSIESATTANSLGSMTVGNAQRPTYFNGGVPTQTTYRMAGTNAAATTAVSIKNDLDTGIWYVSDTSDIYNQSDGVVIANKYSDKWISEIYQDYRTGQLAVRGKNNGTWQNWRKILDSTNYTSYTVKKDGTGASGTWGINISGNAASASKLSAKRTITLTGDVTGSGSSDGSTGWSITATVKDDSHNHVISNVDGLQDALNGKISQGASSLEINSTGSLKDYGGFIDFHYHDENGKPTDASGAVVEKTPDYTSRIIEDAPGVIKVNGVAFQGGNITGTLKGTADKANNLGNYTVGGTSQPVYFNGGVPTAITAVGAAYGGTGKTSLVDSANALLNALSTGNSTPSDNDYFISQYVNGGTTTTTYHRRPISKIYDYIKGKASGTWNINISGNAATATHATTAGSAGTAGKADTADVATKARLTEVILNNTSNWKLGLQWRNTTLESGTYLAGIGRHNTGGPSTNPGSITIVPYATNTEPWGGSVGLFISKDALKFENNTVLHSGNYTSYTVKKDGTGATGTWGINISGNANYATSAGSAGSATSAEYLKTSITFTPAETALTQDNVYKLIGQHGRIKRGTWNYTGNGYIAKGNTTASQCPYGAIDLAGTTVIQAANNSTQYTQIYITPPTASTTNAIKGEMLYYINNGSDYSPTWYRVLTDKNYNSYTVKKNGTGASGTWGISISGNAATATNATNANHATTAGSAGSATKDSAGNTISTYYAPKNHASTATTYGVGDATHYGHVILYPADSCTTFTSDSGGAVTPAAAKKAVTLFTNDYAPTKTGGGASGTWGISISGNAASASTAGTAGKLLDKVSVGGSTTPVYFSKGSPVACGVYSKGTKAFGTVATVGTDGVLEIGRYIDFHYTNNSANDYDVRIDSAGTNKNILYLPGVTGQVVVHTNDTAIGGSDTPVYIAATGAATAASKYAGGTQVKLNNVSKSASTAEFYAPTAAGTAGQVLKSAGSGKAPVWANISDLMDGRFVNASGDTMTGNLTLTGEKATIYKVERKKASGGGWAYAPMRFVGNDNAVFANIGAYGGDDALTYMYIGVGDYNSDVNLRISPTGAVTAKSFVGPLTGNATSATTATKDSSGAIIKNTYVKKAGDTMSGALNTSYQSSTWINSANGKSAINLTGTGYTGWISGNAKDGKLVISSYPSNNNLLYFGYMSNDRIAAGTNSLEQSMTWDGSTNTLTATTFKGALDGNAKTATNATNATNANYAASAGTAGSANTATTANQLAQNTRMDYGWNGLNYFNISGTAGNAAKKNDTPTSAWWHILRFNHANSSGYYTDLAVPFNANSLYYKRIASGTVQNSGWVKVLDALNYNSYAPKLDGTGAKGTWGISISGNAATATNANYAASAGTAGSAGVASKISDITETDKASSSDTKRRIWFAYSNNVTGRPAYDDRFTIQTSTGTLFAPIFSGTLSGAIKDYNDGKLVKFGYSTAGVAQADAVWLGVWDATVSGEYRLRAVKQADLRVAYATNANYATTAGSAGSANTATSATYLTSQGANKANTRTQASTQAVVAGGWSTDDAGYGSTYGTTLDISGYSTWYHRLAFHTNGEIEYWQGINTNTLTKKGRLLTSANYSSYALPLSGGTVTGTLILSKTTDAAADANNGPALIVGGTRTTSHIEIDCNEIIAKSNGTTEADLYLGTNSAKVHIGQSNIGGSTGPIYLKAGVPTACSGRTVPGIKSASAVGTLGWGTNNTYVADISLLAYWNGAYANTSSNLQYCDRGRFGTIVTRDASDYLRYYDANTEMTTTETVNTPTYLHTVSITGGNITTATKPSGVDNAWGVLHVHTHSGNYATQLGFGGTTGNLYMRNAYNSATFGGWRTILDSGNWTGIVDGRYLKLSGGTMSGTINMDNNQISNIGDLSFADPGPNEGISWAGGNGWKIYESPDNLTTNSGGNLQFVVGTTRVLTANTGGFIEVRTSASHSGIKLGNNYVTAINGELIFQNNTAIRFGGDSWDYNVWAGLKYVPSSKSIYLGLADGTQFTANSAQSGGTLALPGIRYFSINGKTAIDANDTWLRINEGRAFSSGIYMGTNIVRTDDQFQVGSGGANFYANSSGNGYFSNTLGIAGTNTGYKLYVNGNARFNGTVLGYNYANSHNAAAFIYDKPGSHYTGIGACDITNMIHLGPCDINGAWVGSYNQIWRFQGDISVGNQIYNTAYRGGMWISGRDNALIRTKYSTSSSSFAPVVSAKTQAGSWDLGPCNPYEDFYFSYASDANYNAGSNSTVTTVRITNAGKIYGAVWNDYAEYRSCTTTFEAGQVVCENGDDTLSLATERLQPGACIVSDTFGFAIGETDIADCPIAVSGRVLAYPYEPRESYKAGDPVCAGPGGTVSKMTREEVREYPDRMIGTVSAIPKYETWGQDNVPVNGRIWIKVV